MNSIREQPRRRALIVAPPSRRRWASRQPCGAACSRWNRDRGREFIITESKRRSLTSSQASAKYAGGQRENRSRARRPAISFLQTRPRLPPAHGNQPIETGAVSMGCRAQHRDTHRRQPAGRDLGVSRSLPASSRITPGRKPDVFLQIVFTDYKTWSNHGRARIPH
jgi:hypothetical protein